MPKVLTAVVCDDELYQSSASDSVALLDVFDLPQLRTLGPMISKIRVHYVCEGASANFSVRVLSQWSVLGKVWSSSTELLAAQTGEKTGMMGNYVNDAAGFGLLMRYLIEVKNSTGSAIESGRVTVILEIELKS